MVMRSVPVTRGSLSHLMVPHSKTCVSTAAGVTKRRPENVGMLAPLFRSDVQVFEIPYLLGDGTLSGQALNARGSKESANALGPTEDVLNIVGLGNGAAMTKDQDLRADGDGCLLDRLNAVNRLIKSKGCLSADGSFCGQSHVRDQEVCACFCHGPGLVFIEYIWAGEQVQVMRSSNHLDFL